MEAKKCDMCKKFFDITELRNQKIKLYLPSSSTSEYDKRLDICMECQDKIFNMITEDVKEAK